MNSQRLNKTSCTKHLLEWWKHKVAIKCSNLKWLWLDCLLSVYTIAVTNVTTWALKFSLYGLICRLAGERAWGEVELETKNMLKASIQNPIQRHCSYKWLRLFDITWKNNLQVFRLQVKGEKCLRIEIQQQNRQAQGYGGVVGIEMQHAEWGWSLCLWIRLKEGEKESALSCSLTHLSRLLWLNRQC